MCSLDETVACHWLKMMLSREDEVRGLASFYPFEWFYAVRNTWQVTKMIALNAIHH